MFPLLPLLLIGFRCVLSSPEPLVSSSGMMSMSENHTPADLREDMVEEREPTRDDVTSLNGGIVEAVPETEPIKDLHVVKKAIPDDHVLFSDFNVTGDEVASDVQSVETSIDLNKNPFVESSEQGEPAPELTQAIQSNEKKIVLHPYVSNSDKVISIPTQIIVPTTTPSPLRRAILHTVAVPQAPGQQFVESATQLTKDQPIDKSDSMMKNVGNKSHVIVENSRVMFLDEGDIGFEEDAVAAPLRFARKSPNETVIANKTEERTTTVSSLDMDDYGDGNMGGSQQNALKLGPPWEDDEIVGNLIEDMMIDPIEVSFKVASRLCHKIVKPDATSTLQSKRYYLWAPINQYVPLLRKAFPFRPPLFAPECLKFVLRQCRGTLRLPMFKPCTYWAPMPIRRPECGFNPNLQSRIVNYRLPEFIPGNCPCAWPCTKRFDPIQRCRVSYNESEQTFDQIHSDGEPWSEKEIVIQENLAAQLCRGMKLALTVDSTIPIGWIPIRVDVDTNHNADEVESDESNSTRKKRSVKSKSKREQIFIKPDKETMSAEGRADDDVDKDDRFTLMGTYNLDRQVSQGGNVTTNVTTIRKCVVWKYKACPREESSREDEGGVMDSKRRRKRSIPSYMSRLVLGLNLDEKNESLWGKKRFVRQSELDEDDFFLQGASECGEWVQSESYRCIPEEHINTHLSATADSGSSSEESEKERKEAASHRRKVVKDLCPGTTGKFPCFLRKKRSLLEENEPATNADYSSEDEELSLQKQQSKRETADGAAAEALDLRQSSMPYITNKIMIKPDPGCMCDWPCFPFFDRVNRCYNSKGEVLMDSLGRPKITGRSFRKTQRDPVVCLNFVEIDEIFCKIKV